MGRCYDCQCRELCSPYEKLVSKMVDCRMSKVSRRKNRLREIWNEMSYRRFTQTSLCYSGVSEWDMEDALDKKWISEI
jgi:hypothetical protein